MTREAVSIRTYESRDAPSALDTILPLYAEVYAEPPYSEGPADIQDFVTSYARRAAEPGFRLEVAVEPDGEPVAFAFGHSLRTDTKWWDGLLDRVPDDLVREYDGRTFAIIELAVKRSHRRRGVATTLHRQLLTDRQEERVTLLSRPEAVPAQAAYHRWGYRVVGRLRPFADAPIYLARIRQLPL